MIRLRALALGIVAAASLSSAVASAHVVDVCWRHEDDGSVTFYAGHYHASSTPVGALIIDGTSYDFTATTTMPPADITCQAQPCGSLTPFRWLIVNVSGLELDSCEVNLTCIGDECGWPGCYPQMMDLAPSCVDDDGDAVCDDADNCLSAGNADQSDADGDGAGDACDVCPFDAEDDADLDGICGDADACAGTIVPESLPTVKLGTNRYADVDGDGVFDTTSSSGPSYTLEDTAGCSCEQIIEALDLGLGHVKYGCSEGVMEEWIGLVSN
jgi:hypothetical protein